MVNTIIIIISMGILMGIELARSLIGLSRLKKGKIEVESYCIFALYLLPMYIGNDYFEYIYMVIYLIILTIIIFVLIILKGYTAKICTIDLESLKVHLQDTLRHRGLNYKIIQKEDILTYKINKYSKIRLNTNYDVIMTNQYIDYYKISFIFMRKRIAQDILNELFSCLDQETKNKQIVRMRFWLIISMISYEILLSGVIIFLLYGMSIRFK